MKHTKEIKWEDIRITEPAREIAAKIEGQEQGTYTKLRNKETGETTTITKQGENEVYVHKSFLFPSPGWTGTGNLMRAMSRHEVEIVGVF